MPDIAVALAGYGYAGKTIHAPLIEAAEGLRLAAVVSSRPDAVHSDFPDMAVTTFEAALADPAIGLVVIATPNDRHAPMAHAALDAGKHVVIDKPFCLTVRDGEALAEHAARAGRLLSVFHCRRWDSNYLTFQSLRDRVGDAVQLVLRYDRWRPAVRDRWRERAGPGSGIWFDLGSHLVDQTLSLFGWPDWIDADIAAQRAGAQTDDYFHVVLGYGPERHNLRAILHSSMLTAAPGPAFEVQGSRGAFLKSGMDIQENLLKAGKRPGAPGWDVDLGDARFTPVDGDASGKPESVTAVPGNYLAYYEAIAGAITDGAPNPVSPDDALRVMRVLEAGFASARDGRRISL